MHIHECAFYFFLLFVRPKLTSVACDPIKTTCLVCFCLLACLLACLFASAPNRCFFFMPRVTSNYFPRSSCWRVMMRVYLFVWFVCLFVCLFYLLCFALLCVVLFAFFCFPRLPHWHELNQPGGTDTRVRIAALHGISLGRCRLRPVAWWFPGIRFLKALGT